MNSIDDDAKLVGISPDVWEDFKRTFKYEQMEFESIVGPIDDKEAEERHRASMAKRWFFGYYLKRRNDKNKYKLIEQYNKICSFGKTRS